METILVKDPVKDIWNSMRRKYQGPTNKGEACLIKSITQ